MDNNKYVVITGSEQLLQLMKRVNKKGNSCSYGYAVENGKATYSEDEACMAINKYPTIFRISYKYDNPHIDHMPFTSIDCECLDWITKAMSIEKFIKREKKWKKK